MHDQDVDGFPGGGHSRDILHDSSISPPVQLRDDHRQGGPSGGIAVPPGPAPYDAIRARGDVDVEIDVDLGGPQDDAIQLIDGRRDRC